MESQQKNWGEIASFQIRIFSKTFLVFSKGQSGKSFQKDANSVENKNSPFAVKNILKWLLSETQLTRENLWAVRVK